MAGATKFTVNMSLPAEIVIGATGLVGLAQEVRTVLGTRKGSVPLDRDFGLTWDHVDRALPAAMQQMVADISIQLQRYVPRIQVDGIQFEETPDDETAEGLLRPVVTCSVREEYYGELR